MEATELKSYVPGYDARVLADSVTQNGHRLLTYVATVPRMILAEINTHRILSKNSASSRAIPPEKTIEAVKTNPFVPFTFNNRVKGMGIGEPMSADDQRKCRDIWLKARDHAVEAAEQFIELGLDKSRVNRVLEPYSWHTIIISGTEWENFHGLRTPDTWMYDGDFPAQVEFQVFAAMLRELGQISKPQILFPGQWHMPLVTEDDYLELPDAQQLPLVSAGRCAKVSYMTHERHETAAESIARANTLAVSGHWSPMEHPATPADPSPFGEPTGSNFQGWVQLRKLYSHEANALASRYPNAQDREQWLYG